MTFFDKLKDFGKEMALQIAFEFIQSYILDMVKDFGPADAYKAISEDIDLWEVTPETEKAHVTFNLAPRFKPIVLQYLDKLTPDLVLGWLEEKRPDFAGTIINYPENKGLVWWEKQVENVKENIRRAVTS